MNLDDLSIVIGFTGTRRGMTVPQARGVVRFLAFQPESVAGFHHGDCVGADAQAHSLALQVGIRRIEIHPPSDPRARAFCQGAAVVHEEKSYRDRNHDIVDASHLLLAAPGGQEGKRSGTWATIRYARRAAGMPIVIIMPDGKELDS